MVIRKYKAATEKEAILLAKEDLGPDAIVMNIKTIKPGGILRIFKRSRVELTAAIDENMEKEKKLADEKNKKREAEEIKFGRGFEAKEKAEGETEAANAIEEKINSIAKLLEEQMSSNREQAERERQAKKEASEKEEKEEKKTEETTEKKETPEEKEETENKVISLIKKQLIEGEVKPEYADIILSEVDAKGDKIQLDNILAAVYQKIVLKLGNIEPIVPAKEKKPKLLFFVGNTGVGKSTTIAKLASRLCLMEKKKIAIFSVDTYRVAAIEQMKTYANILKVPLVVAYTPEELVENIEKHKSCDYILIDTAGRSHKNEDQKKDLLAVIDTAKDYEYETYLVLSASVKYSDLLDMAAAYGKLFDYKLIFTKLDETNGNGTILNMKLDTGKALSYVTWGQNVPEDIGLLDPQVVAKKLLGGEQA